MPIRFELPDGRAVGALQIVHDLALLEVADKLLPLFPPHECYVEVFCGCAALYFLRPVPEPVEVINNINGDLVNLYRVVQHHLEEFVRSSNGR